MAGTLSIKVCGITRLQDAQWALSFGADYIGVIGYPASPRFVDPSQWSSLLSTIPKGKRVWVSVAPGPKEMEMAFHAGFDVIQAHFNPDQEWNPAKECTLFPSEKIWLAPKMKQASSFLPEWLALCDRILVDGFSTQEFGGTGKRVHPTLFRSFLEKYPQGTFILAGGLSPNNIIQALEETGASYVDVNSGVEDSPGCKSKLKLRKLFQEIRVGLDKERKYP